MTLGFGSSLLSIKHHPICLVVFSTGCVPWALISWATHPGALEEHLLQEPLGPPVFPPHYIWVIPSCSHCVLTQAYQGKHCRECARFILKVTLISVPISCWQVQVINNSLSRIRREKMGKCWGTENACQTISLGNPRTGNLHTAG